MPLSQLGAEVVDEALGRNHRRDPVVARTGGPAGNAQITAWTGLVLLVLSAAELVTLVDVTGLISWHVVLGVLLVPPALLKTATTGWRVGRYYTGHRSYRQAGPPPTLLRLLGPLVVLSTLGVLGSGLALIALGPDASRQPLLTALGFSLTAVTVHQALFVSWGASTGVHLLARLAPALRLTGLRLARGVARVPGAGPRVGALAAALLAGSVTAALILGAVGEWGQRR